MHKFLWSIIGISITVMLSLFLGQPESQFVNAEQANMATVIEDKFTREIGSGQVMPPVSHSWVKVMYESPNSIILGGERDVDTRLQPSTYWNTDLWAAMDLLKNQYGFKLQQVMTNGVGSVGNPTTVYILMIK
jgi:hypothetical protein